MNKKTIFLLIFLIYISVYTLYNLQVVTSMMNTNPGIQKLEIPKIIILSIGLLGNLFVLFFMINLNWMITSLGITINKGEDIHKYKHVKKIDYYIIYFSNYIINFILLFSIAIFQWETFVQDFNFILKFINIIIVIFTFSTLMFYMYKNKILTKFSLVGISLISMVNLGYTLYN